MVGKNYLRLLKSGVASAILFTSVLGAAPLTLSANVLEEDELELRQVVEEAETIAEAKVLDVYVDQGSYFPGDTIEISAEFSSGIPVKAATVIYIGDDGSEFRLGLHILHEESKGIYYGRGENWIATNDTDMHYTFSYIEIENQNGDSQQIYNNDIYSSFYIQANDIIENKLNKSLIDIRKVNSKNSYQEADLVEFEVELEANTEFESLELQFNGQRHNNLAWPKVKINELSLNKDGNLIGQGSFKVKPLMPNDIYDMTSITGLNSKGETYYYDDLSRFKNLSFEITNSLFPDQFTPTLKDIKINKEKINSGEEFEVEVLVESDRLVDSVHLEIVSANLGEIEYFAINDLEEVSEGLYSGKTSFSPNFGAGINSISSVMINDQFNLTKEVDVRNLDLDIYVSEPLLSNTPTIETIKFENREYMGGESIEFEVTIKHNYPLQMLTLDFESESYESFYNPGVYIAKFTNVEKGVYVGKGTLRVSNIDFSNIDAALFKLKTGYVSDIYGNGTLVDLNDFDIEIIFTENTDSKGPQLIDLSFDKEEYYIGDMVTLNIEASDITNVHDLIIELGDRYNSNVYQHLFISNDLANNFTQNKITGNYLGEIQFKLNLNGYYYFNTIDDHLYLSSLLLFDNFYNQAEYNYFDIEKIMKNSMPSFKVKAIKTVEDITVKETPFTTEIKYNPEVLAGTRKVIQAGVAGTETITEEITYGFGVEVKREIISNEKVEPVTEIIEVGTKAAVIEDNASKKVVDNKTGIAVAVKGSDKSLNLVAKEIGKDTVDNLANVIFEKPEAKKAIKVLGTEYAVFDIHLTNPDGTEVNPEDSVRVTIPYSSEFKPEKLYHFGDEFEAITELDFIDNGDSIEFEVSKFSYFGIQFALAAEAEETETPVTPVEPDEDNVVEEEAESKTSDEIEVEKPATESKDSGDLPATGEALSISTTLIGTLFTTMGLAIRFKKRKK